jgi:NADPH2:quinone reductase
MYSIVATQPGDTSVLQKKEFEISEILPTQVLIKNHSIGVNFIDIYFRKGLYPWPQENNLILGSEGAGIIEAVGSDVQNLRVGDRVAYAQANNAYATHRVLDASLVVRIPDTISFDQAAAAMLKGLTVRYLLKDSFEVKKSSYGFISCCCWGCRINRRPMDESFRSQDYWYCRK